MATHTLVTMRDIHGLQADLPLQIAILNHGPERVISANDLMRFLEIPHDRPAFIANYLGTYHFQPQVDYHVQELNPAVSEALQAHCIKTDTLLTIRCAYAFCIMVNSPLSRLVARHFAECQLPHNQDPGATVDVAIVQDELWKARPRWQRIHALLKEGHKIKKIAELTKRPRKDVAYAIERMKVTGLLVAERET